MCAHYLTQVLTSYVPVFDQYALSQLYMCSHTAIYVSSYYHIFWQVLTSYVPFFDQYALSQNLWSPDSKSFCYTARGADGGLGAYVQDVPASAGQVARPRLVFSGAQTVSWSPF